MAKSANGSFRAARDALDLTIDDKQLAIVSSIGAEALRQQIQHNRKKFLRETMDKAQPTLETFSDHMVTTFDLLAGDVTTTYLAWVDQQRVAYDALGSGGVSGQAAADLTVRRKEVLLEVLDRNEQVLILLETIRALREGYRTLPSAHAELRASLDGQESFFAQTKRLYEDARRLQKLYKELAATDNT
jgi:hypothetical protein